MRLLEQTIAPSPDQADSLRISVDLEMEGAGTILNVWFDVPEAYGDRVSQSGNPWLILMLPIAMATGENIVIPLPVDSLLLENVRGLMGVWEGWFPELRRVEIEAPLSSSRHSSAGRRGLYFSGGVDSFFTLLRHDLATTGGGGGPVDTLIFIGGFDFQLSAKERVLLVREELRRVTGEFNKSFLPVLTNLRQWDTPYKTNWILSHGCALATVGHLLDGEFAEILISSSYEYGHLLRIGSHPMTDPLLSSRHLRFIHDGATFTRPEKIAQVGGSDRALRNLRVCYAPGQHYNCSRCPKCLFTMVTIDVLGFAERATSFDWNAYKMESIAGLLLGDLQIGRAQKLIAAARHNNRNELVAALQQSVDRSLNIRRAVNVTRRLPFLWRFEHQVREFMQRGAMRLH